MSYHRTVSIVSSVLCAMLLLAGAPRVADAASSSPSPSWDRVLGIHLKHSSPTIADVDGDGVNDVVVGGHDGYVRVFDANGKSLEGWPQPVKIKGSPTAIDSSPTVADLDGDGRNEVIVGAGSGWVDGQSGGLVVFNRDGSVRWKFVTKDRLEGGDGLSDGVFSTPAVGDVDGDGFPDIVFGAWDHYIYALNRHGQMLPGFPWFNQDTVWSSPALYDVDRDGRQEIFIGGDSSPGGNGWEEAGGIMWRLDASRSGVEQTWRHHIGEIIISSPALGDIDGDGRMEVVFGTGDFWKTADSRKVFALNTENGSPVSGWPVTVDGYTWGSPALGDVNNDGRLEVVIGDRAGKLHAFRGNGSRLWRVDSGSGDIISSPIIADVDGDKRLEVAVAASNGVYVRDGATGASEGVFARHWNYFAAPAIGDFGKHGTKIVVAGFRHEERKARIAAYSVPKPGVASPWPMFSQNPAHTGVVDGARSGAKGGYWILDTAGDVYSFGNAKFRGSLGTVGVRSTPRDIIPTASGNGYWILDSVGGMFSFGDAKFYGSVPQLRDQGHKIGRADIIGMAPTPTGEGYWILDSAGGMFSFGDAKFHGSVPGLRDAGVKIGRTNIIGMAPTPTGKGYWILDAVGGMFSFGDAKFHGSVPHLRDAGVKIGRADIVGMAPTASGEGYWLLDAAGGQFAFGDAKFYGSVPGLRAEGRVTGPVTVVSMTPTASGEGYWMLDDKGGIFAFGNASYHGSLPAVGVSSGGVAMAST